MIVYERTYFGDTGGKALDNGKLYIGQANKDPEVFPIACFWDPALTVSAAQPLAISSGYVINAGARAAVYTVDASYSLRVRDRHDLQVDYIAEVESLEADLAAPEGSNLVGFSHAETYDQNTIGRKLQQTINVSDAPFNAPVDGETDAAPAFRAAYLAAPAGSAIDVPEMLAGCFLSFDPDDRSKAVTWNIIGKTKFYGPGVGNVAPWGNGRFLSLITNPYLQVYGEQHRYFLGDRRSPLGGALMGESWELMPDPVVGYPFTFTANITNGSPTLTNCTGDLSILYPGDRLDSAYDGWPNFPAQIPFRIWEVDPAAKTITFGADAGAGPAGPFNWGGLSGAITVTAQKRNWFSLMYRGVTTGGPNAPDEVYGICNDVLNITGSPGTGYELDINSDGHVPNHIMRGMFLTGGGAEPNDFIAFDAQRGGSVSWSCAYSARNARTGIFLNAYFPISLDTQYFDNTTGNIVPIGHGVHFNNAPVVKGALLEGRQIEDGRAAISLWRKTDVSPSTGGRFLQCIDAANSGELMFVDINGVIKTYAPANGNGSTVGAGSIECNGITLRGGTQIQYGTLAALSTATATHQLVIGYDSAGNKITVNVKVG